MKGRKIILIMIFVAVALSIALIYKQRTDPDIVYMCGGFYDTGCRELRLDCCNEDRCDLRDLKYFSAAEYIDISSLDTDREILMPETVSQISLTFSGCKIRNNSFRDVPKNIDELRFVGTSVDISEFSNDNIKKLTFILGSIDNFDRLGSCPAVEELCLHGVGFQGLEQTDIVPVIYELHDSSVFSGFDSVKSLEICQINIYDISGFLDMQSLEEICLWEEYISPEDVRELTEAGIRVEFLKHMAV